MRQMVWDVLKVMIIFLFCTFMFYFGLRAMHHEYEEYHRYDQPEGPSVKVFNEDKTFLDWLNIF